mgnify:CR=1 FL=1
MFRSVRYVLILFFLFAKPSLSETNVYIYLTVNEEIVTNYDIEKEVRYLEILNPNLASLDKENKFEIGKTSMINEIIKKKEPFIVINGDIVANFDLNEILDFHNLKKASLTVVTRSYEVQNPYGIVQTNKSNMITSMREKPIYNSEVLAGIYIIDSKLASFIPSKKKFDMTDLINLLLNSKNYEFSFQNFLNPLH